MHLCWRSVFGSTHFHPPWVHFHPLQCIVGSFSSTGHFFPAGNIASVTIHAPMQTIWGITWSCCAKFSISHCSAPVADQFSPLVKLNHTADWCWMFKWGSFRRRSHQKPSALICSSMPFSALSYVLLCRPLCFCMAPIVCWYVWFRWHGTLICIVMMSMYVDMFGYICWLSWYVWQCKYGTLGCMVLIVWYDGIVSCYIWLPWYGMLVHIATMVWCAGMYA